MAGIPEWVVEMSLGREVCVVTDDEKVGGANVTSSSGEGKDGENLRGRRTKRHQKGGVVTAFIPL